MNRKILVFLLFFVLFASVYSPLPPAHATASRLMGVNMFDADEETTLENFQFIAAQGANTVDEALCYETWATDAGYRSFWTTWANNAHAAGLMVILSCYSTVPNPPEGWVQMKYNAVYYTSYKNAWINGFATMIDALQPDGVNPMNEPESPITAYDLKNFYLACIDHWLIHKADLFFVIQGVPWWDINSILTDPRIDVQRPGSTFYYATHYYYSYLNEVPLPSEGHPEMIDYWNGNLGPAQTELYNYYDNGCGVQAALNLGLNVMFEEFGTHILNPNFDQFMYDTFDYAETYGISVLWVGWWENDYTHGSFAGTGMIDDYTPTLNDIGDIWVSYMTGNPIPAMPSNVIALFADDFERTDLSPKWINETESTNDLIELSTAQHYRGVKSLYLGAEGDNENDGIPYVLNSSSFAVPTKDLWLKVWVYPHWNETSVSGSSMLEWRIGGSSHKIKLYDQWENSTWYWEFNQGGDADAVIKGVQQNWVLIEWHIFIDNTNGYEELYVNGLLSQERTAGIWGEGEYDTSGYATISDQRLYARNDAPDYSGYNDVYYDDYGLYYEPIIGDTQPPIYSSLAYSGTITGSIVKFTVTANDNETLDHAIFTTNNTGSWQTTTITFTATPQQANVSKVLTSTPSVKVGYRWYIFDTSENMNDTGIYYLTTTYVAPPITPPTPGTSGAIMVDIYPVIMLIFLAGAGLVLVSSKRNCYASKRKISL